MKWLSEIEAVERPFDGFFQVDRYVYEWTRNGQQVTEPVTLQRVRALITEPAHEQELESGDLTIRGVAWSGAAPIARVDVSVDNGPWHIRRACSTRGSATAGSGGNWPSSWTDQARTRFGHGPPTWPAAPSPTTQNGTASATAATQFSKCASIAPRLDELAQGRATA